MLRPPRNSSSCTTTGEMRNAEKQLPPISSLPQEAMVTRERATLRVTRRHLDWKRGRLCPGLASLNGGGRGGIQWRNLQRLLSSGNSGHASGAMRGRSRCVRYIVSTKNVANWDISATTGPWKNSTRHIRRPEETKREKACCKMYVKVTPRLRRALTRVPLSSRGQPKEA